MTKAKRTFRIRGNRVTITERGKRTTYEWCVFPVDAEFGEAGVRLRKIDGQSYDVLVGGEYPLCECKGFLRWGRCKHLDLASKLVERNKPKDNDHAA